MIDLKNYIRAIKKFCSEEENGVKIVVYELNKGYCFPCNWEVE